eukprot:370744_1
MALQIATGYSPTLFAASIGNIIALIVNTTLLSNLLYHYNAIFHNNNSKSTVRSNKSAYMLVIIYLTCGSIQICSLLFIRTNAITRISPDQFTLLQCRIGFALNWLGIFGSVSMVYVVFIHRIYIVFKGSVYEYKRYCFILLYCMIITLICVTAILRIIEYINEPILSLIFDQTNYILFCRHALTSTQLRAVSIVFIIYIMFMDITLLYMFTSNLYLVHRDRIKIFVENHRNQESRQQMHLSSGYLSMAVVHETIKKKNTEYNLFMRHDVEKLFALHDIIKKQTILTCIAILSSVTLWSFIAYDNVYFLLIPWDVSVNTICVWLMLKSSKHYWICCKRYGPCVCFYRNEMAAQLHGIRLTN